MTTKLTEQQKNSFIERYKKHHQNAVKLAPPTIQLARKIDALFARDPDVFTIYNYNENALTVYVKGANKSEAINYLLRHKEADGVSPTSIIKTICVVRVLEDGEYEEQPSPTYEVTTAQKLEYIKDAFHGSIEILDTTITDPIMQTTFYFAEVEALPVSVPVDSLANPLGYDTYLAADLIKELLDVSGGSKPLLVSTVAPRRKCATMFFGWQCDGYVVD